MNKPNKSMRESSVLKRLKANQIASCYKLNLDSARAAEIAALAGFDCLWTDLEHVANDWSLIEKQIWAAKSHDVDVMVRVARGSYSDYIRPLELDAAGIMVPHIMSLADARQVMRMIRFHPIGRRPVDGGNADGLYGTLGLTEYLEQSNSHKFVVLQIEDPEPLPDLDAIAALDGVDMLFFGPYDFSHGLGAPGQWNHPELIRARQEVARAAAKHGKFAGTIANPREVNDLVKLGYRFLSIGSDVIGVGQHCQTLLSQMSHGGQ